MAEVILAVEENNNSKESRKKTTKKKRQDKPRRVGISLNQQFIWARHFLRKRYYSFFLAVVYLALKS